MKGKLYILTAPSGGGKTTLAKALVQKLPNIQLSVSYTTRAMRPGEQEGVHYCFVAVDEFERLIHAQKFLEYAYVHGHYYGTSLMYIEETLEKGIDVILAIDWQGAQKVRALYPEVVTIFILPPSKAALKERLELRAQDPAEVIQKRLAVAAEEISHFVEFDYIIINDQLEEAMLDIEAVVRAHRLTRDVQIQKQEKILVAWKK